MTNAGYDKKINITILKEISYILKYKSPEEVGSYLLSPLTNEGLCIVCATIKTNEKNKKK
jgi:hypothetical protein